MRCLRCQSENPSQAKFCLECGARLALTCPKCRIELPAGANFCSECGESVTSLTAAESRFVSPASYTPTHLAERILTSRSALEGERKQVTVLFADLKGSMDLLGERDPEDARRLLDPVLQHMMEAVRRYEGTVSQVMGDGIMALFGAPLAHEDHAVRACYAGLSMQDAVRRYAEDIRRREGITLQIRVGLNSGEVVVRSIGSDLRMDYSAVGQTTHLAARMEQHATPGSVLITPATFRLAEGYVAVKPVGPIRVKGLPDAIEVYELEGARGARRRLQATAARGLTRFVGREVELEQLGQALEQAAAGHGQVVAVVGEAGVGKSRLLHEFTHSHYARDWLILESGSVSYGKATPYLPVIDLLKAYFQIDASDDGNTARERVTAKLLALGETLKPTLAALLALVGAPLDDPEWQALDPAQRRRRTLDAATRLLLRESQIQPTLLVFEDLHWIDSETQAVLDGLVERLPTARMLLLVNYRPEYQHAWGTKTYYTQLPIDPLPPDGAKSVLRALLGDDVARQPLGRLLIDRAEGNPFFLEESVRTLVETRALVGQPGAYRLAKTISTIQIPATIQAILAARIDRLPPEDKRLLQCAAVIGKDVPFDLLHAIADIPEDEVRRELADLRAAEFLYEARFFPDPEYTFKHALTHEVAYGSLLQDRRRTVHATIAAAIERLYRDRLSEHAERLAHHAFRAELWDKAVTYHHQAAAKAMSHSAYREAVGYLEQALAAIHHRPETRETLEQSIDLRSDLRAALFPLGEFGKLLGYLREAERLSRTLDDQRRLGWVSAFMIIALWITGDATEALASGRRAETLAATIADVALRAVVSTHIGLVCTTLGDYRAAESHLGRAAQLLRGDLSHKALGRAGFPAVLSRCFLTMGLADRGEFDRGVVSGRECLGIAETLKHSWPLVLGSWSLGYLAGIRGELGEAIRLLERCLTLTRDGNIAFFSPVVAWLLGRTYALSGRVGEGLALLQSGLTDMEAMGLSPYHAVALVDHGEALVLCDRLDDAGSCGERALRLARERGERGYEALALRLLGEIAARRDPSDVEMAEEHYRCAMGLAAELAMRPLTAHCQLGLGRLYRRIGKRERTQEHLAVATAMFREMGMRLWLGRAEAEMAGSS